MAFWIFEMAVGGIKTKIIVILQALNINKNRVRES
jgi:hypothetical protein